MRFVTLAVVLLFSATIQCYASPTLYGENIAQFDHFSKAIERAAKIFSVVQGVTKSVLQKQDINLASFTPNRKLLQQPGPDPSQYTCPTATSSACSVKQGDPIIPCMMAFGESGSALQSAAGNPFAIGSVFCAMPSCAALLTNYIKTCACIDFQPLYDISCPSSPTAHECAKNPYVQAIVSLSTDPEESLFSTSGMMLFSQLMPNPSKPTDYSQCGNSSVYKRTIIINGLGSCLDSLIAAFPIPTFLQDRPVPGMEKVTYKQMITPSLKCVVIAPSYVLQALCSGNVGKCYSAATLVPNCVGKITPSMCTPACKADLARLGAVDSDSPAKCCVKWFQDQATAPPCSTTPTLTFPTVMGPECVKFYKMIVDASGTSIPDAYFTQPMFPAPCSARSDASLSVANCGVNTPLAASCPADTSTPFVQASLYAPKRTSTVTITFTSSSLKAFLGRKYSETLKSIQSTLESRLPPGVSVEVVSVKATSGRRLLQSGNTMVATVAVAATAANTNDFNPQTACAAIPPAEFQSALTTALKKNVDSTIVVDSMQPLSASTVQTAPQPGQLPNTAPVKPPPTIISSSSTAHLAILLLFLCAALLF